jgi:hypothetical protein
VDGVVGKVLREEAERAQDGRGGHLDQTAVALAACERRHFLDLGGVVAGLAVTDLLEDRGERVRLHAAGRTLAALLAHEELGDLDDPLDDAFALLEEADAAAAEARPGMRQASCRG